MGSKLCDYLKSLTFFFFLILGPHLQHMEVLRLEVESELQLPVYTIDTATQDPSYLCELQCNSQQRQILSPLSKARDRTHNLMDTSWAPNLLSRSGNS